MEDGGQLIVINQLYGVYRVYITQILAVMQSVEKTYKKVTQIEHVLMRPDMYIGACTETEQLMWVLQNEEFIQKKIKYIPGLYKIFDEILVNAADNYQRDKKMTKIEVSINKEQITILNDGKSIPVQIHKVHKIYVPELIFGHLLTSSNYEDSEKKVTGGRNGFGAKLANIFSNEFYIEVADSAHKKLFKLKWRKNMTEMDAPIIEEYSGSDYTKVQFRPDYKRFQINKLTPDMLALLKKRVYDVAGIVKVKVYLNSKLIPIPSFKEYVKKYLTQESQVLAQTSYNKNSRWQVLACRSDGHFMQISFVNGIATQKGGTHVNYIVDQIIDKIINSMPKKNAEAIKPFQVKAHLNVYINCLIENPSFDSQTKQTLTTNLRDFGSSCVISDAFIKELLKSGITDRVLSEIKLKENSKIQKQLKKIKKNRLIIPKLEDANQAGKSEKCTLILTEGDSAKALALCGIEELGRDYYGVFPLKGKVTNVKSMTPKQVMQNAELSSIVKIFGLTFQREYRDTSDLRYSTVMIMADQDNDGSHIKGLVINFFQTFWPSLCKIDGFLKEFITPIIKCKKGAQSLTFYSQVDFSRWKEQNILPGWSIKYYKGLGTSTSKQAKQYFNKLQNHEIKFSYGTQQDKMALQLAFDKKNTDLRKTWLRQYDPQKCLDHNIKTVTIEDFINKELIHFSNSDNIRSIPSAIDGLKPSQRKILYACFKRNLNSEIKVAQLAGYVAQHSAYHHGEQSLCSTIVAMAQNFIGSNNLNLLQPIGQFGTRYQNGKDSASARYIFTKLNPLTRYLFIEADDHVVEYQQQQNQVIQPKYYLPILPLVLINGAEGIGTGWSTTIYPHRVQDVIKLVRSRINQGSTQICLGWENFQGKVRRDNKGGFIVEGNYEINDTEVTITEIPPNKSIRDYKSFLQQKLQSLQNDDPDIQDLKQYHSNSKIQFMIRFIDQKTPHDTQMQKYLKLSTTYQETNMNLFTSDYKIKKFDRIDEIFEEFYIQRMQGYTLRKRYLISKYRKEFLIIQNQIRFISEIIEGKQFRLMQSKEEWISKLKKGNYARYQQINKIESTKNKEDDQNQKNSDFNYLLHLPIWNFCKEKIEELSGVQRELSTIIDHYTRISEKEMWLKDIDQLETAWQTAVAGQEVKQHKNSKKQQRTLLQNMKNQTKKRNFKQLKPKEILQQIQPIKRQSRSSKNLMQEQVQKEYERKPQKKVKIAKEQFQQKQQPSPLFIKPKKEQKQSGIESLLSKYLNEDNQPQKNEPSLLERIKGRISGGDTVFNTSYKQTKQQLANKKEAEKMKDESQQDINDYLI